MMIDFTKHAPKAEDEDEDEKWQNDIPDTLTISLDGFDGSCGANCQKAELETEIVRLRDEAKTIVKITIRNAEENKRLREALREIYEYRTRNTLPVSAITLRNIARVALKESGDD